MKAATAFGSTMLGVKLEECCNVEKASDDQAQ